MMTTSIPESKQSYYPYQPGSMIKVEFYPEEAPKDEEQYVYVEHTDIKDGTQHSHKHSSVSLKVVRTLSRTYSCVLLVSLVPDPRGRRLPSSRLPSESYMVLKLCDRRFANELREEYKAQEWTPKIETDFVAFHALPKGQKPEIKVSNGFHDDSWYEGGDDDSSSEETVDREASPKAKKNNAMPQERWTPGHREAYLQGWCDKLYQQEVEIYRALYNVQGEKVPCLYGTVSILRKNRSGGPKVQAKGLLMEYKSSSFSLRDIPQKIPKQALWHGIGTAAVKLVQEIGDLGVLNRDVRLDNILVVPVPKSSAKRSSKVKSESQLADEEERSSQKIKFKVVMIDFGLARLQGEDETDEEFRKARMMQDEEGAVGFVLQGHLLKHVQDPELSKDKNIEKPFNFKHSRRLNRSWDNDEADI